MLPPFEVTVQRDGARVIIAVRGEVDMASSPSLTAELQRAIRDGARVELDMAAVDFIDAAGVGALLACGRHAHATGATLTLVAASRPVRRVLDVLEIRDFDGHPHGGGNSSG